MYTDAASLPLVEQTTRGCGCGCDHTDNAPPTGTKELDMTSETTPPRPTPSPR